ncbi:hypothetical protein BHE74_00029499 [Ensete ventricosum]|nr:hypothetical protein BHE74_00029499 [Ensete ventricosum]
MSLTTMNETISIFNLGSSPMVTGRVISLRGEIESLVNPVNVDVMGKRSRDAVVGLKRELTKMLSSNSFASESKEEMNDGRSRLYHIRAGPLTVVRKAQHIRASKVS